MLELLNISKSYKGVKILEGINLSVNNGEILCIYGRSGSGKTTLLKIAGLITEPDTGEVVINRSKVTRENINDFRKIIGFSFQEPLLLPYLNVVENVVVLNSMIKKVNEKDAVELLNRLGLSHRLKSRPYNLSMGEKKRVDLARAIIKDPLILIADEPFSNLDPENKKIVSEIFLELSKNNKVIVYSAVNPQECSFSTRSINILDINKAV